MIEGIFLTALLVLAGTAWPHFSRAFKARTAEIERAELQAADYPVQFAPRERALTYYEWWNAE